MAKENFPNIDISCQNCGGTLSIYRITRTWIDMKSLITDLLDPSIDSSVDA